MHKTYDVKINFVSERRKMSGRERQTLIMEASRAVAGSFHDSTFFGTTTRWKGRGGGGGGEQQHTRHPKHTKKIFWKGIWGLSPSDLGWIVDEYEWRTVFQTQIIYDDRAYRLTSWSENSFCHWKVGLPWQYLIRKYSRTRSRRERCVTYGKSGSDTFSSMHVWGTDVVNFKALDKH